MEQISPEEPRRHLALASTLLCFLPVVSACEIANVGQLVVTWRFNNAPLTSEDSPCKVMFAEKRPSPAGLIRIELIGPTHFVDYVACESTEAEYPLRFYQSFAGSPPDVYARFLKDVPKGRYTIRASFIDRNGMDVADPAPIEQSISISRDKTARIDFDFPLIYGRVDVRWSFDEEGTDCQSAGVSVARIRLVEQTSSVTIEERYSCEGHSTDATPFTPVPPGSYSVELSLLDDEEQQVGVSKESIVQVEAARVADTITFTFDATDLQ